MKRMFPAHWGPKRLNKAQPDGDAQLDEYVHEVAVQGALYMAVALLAICPMIYFAL